MTEPLQALTRQGKKFILTEAHKENFHTIKERLCNDMVLVPFDPYRDTRLYSKGGPKGCQARVVQRYKHPEVGEQWRPVAHTSKA